MTLSLPGPIRKLLPDGLRGAKMPPPQELALLALFVAYIVFPVKMPAGAARAVGSPLGLLSIVCVTLFLFAYTHPDLGVVYLFVAYELIRRSGAGLPDVRALDAQYAPIPTPQQARAPIVQSPLLVDRDATLEEDIIQKMAPVGGPGVGAFLDTPFKPMLENIHSALSV